MICWHWIVLNVATQQSLGHGKPRKMRKKTWARIIVTLSESHLWRVVAYLLWESCCQRLQWRSWFIPRDSWDDPPSRNVDDTFHVMRHWPFQCISYLVGDEAIKAGICSQTSLFRIARILDRILSDRKTKRFESYQGELMLTSSPLDFHAACGVVVLFRSTEST